MILIRNHRAFLDQDQFLGLAFTEEPKMVFIHSPDSKALIRIRGGFKMTQQEQSRMISEVSGFLKQALHYPYRVDVTLIIKIESTFADELSVRS